MNLSSVCDLSAYGSPDVDAILELLDPFIRTLARKRVPRDIVHPAMADLEIDEIAQNVRIKLWFTLQKRNITNLKAYIRCIVYTETMDMLRQHKVISPLPIDEDGELYPGNLLVTPSEGMQDPLYELEQKEMMATYISETVSATLLLPPRQRHAVICMLKEQIDDFFQLSDAFREHEVNVEIVDWPEGQVDMKRLKASLSAARKKLRALKSKHDLV